MQAGSRRGRRPAARAGGVNAEVGRGLYRGGALNVRLWLLADLLSLP